MYVHYLKIPIRAGDLQKRLAACPLKQITGEKNQQALGVMS